MSSLPFQVCAITAVDGVSGYAQAYHFLRRLCDEYNKSKVEVRLLCRDSTGLDELENMGGHIIKTDYQNQDMLAQHLSGVQYVIFIPEITDNMLADGISIIEAAKKASVGYFAMYSCLGVHKALRTTRTMDMYCLEAIVATHFGYDHHCVFRVPFIAQAFYFLTPWVEAENKLYMPVRPDRKFAVADLKDIVRAVFNLSICVPAEPGNNQTLFQFTPTQRCLTPVGMVDAMTKGLEWTQPILYQTIDSRRLRKDLEEIRKRKQFKEPLPSKEIFARPLGAYLTNAMIGHLLEYWEMAEDGQLDIVTDDLKKALGSNHPPHELEEFFKVNRDDFDHFR